ncbi:acyltransferase family protein [Pontibacter russatus]|uniref:acyltransferase family protein n=1 Tax=Pontibacter russatus TaxID=2694929 RepID=UPI00137AA39A|nr:heparan-alpha-glucosaminide N-acetyltransferase domain-containing protein [Pontibacter russatus]
MNKLFTAQAVSPDGLLKPATRQRYLSLDVLRGMTIALMIVVNTPGSWQNVYAPFRHAAWHGFTVTDLVFPTFLFVVGNAMSFSMRKFERQGDGAFLRKVFTRTALIFLIGLFLNAFPFVSRTDTGGLALIDFSDIRIMGVLQRIALCYGIAALVVHYLKVKGAIVFSAIALLAYWAMMYFFGDQPDPYSLEGNAALKFDLLLIPTDNLYGGYGIPFDPEGLLSTLPAIVNVIGGFLAGLYIQRNGNNMGTVFKLALSAAVCIVVALVWDVYFPINKPIWTSSYVVYTIGLDLLVLAVLMLVIEVANYKGWTYFFEVFGRNPLFIYALSGIIIELLGLIPVGDTSLRGWLYDNLYLSWLAGNNASLLFAVSYMLLLWLIGYWMDKKRVYIKV